MDVGNLFVPVFTGRYKCSTPIFVFFLNLFINSKYVQSIYVMQSDVTDSRIEARKHIELCVFQMNHSNQRSEH